jgi:hypothetical protein
MKRDRQDCDRLVAVSLFLLGVLTRLPFRSQILYHWDSVNFALGMEHFDVYLHQPHPPGYFLYVMLGRLVNLWIGDANASLVWISTVATGLAAVVIFLMGQSLWDRRSGIVAALLLLTSPLFWFHGEVALTYMIEAVFVTLVAFLCYRHLAGNDDRIWLSALVLGTAGGFRQNTMVFLLPLWMIATWRFRWRRIFLALIVLALTCAAWLLPMMALTGGMTRYWQAVGAASQGIAEESSVLDWKQLVINGTRLTVFICYALSTGLIPMALGVWYWVKRHLKQWRSWVLGPRVQTFFWWITPSLFFYLFVHIRQPGHSFTFMPAVLLVLAFILIEIMPQATRQWKRGRRWSNLLLMLIIVSNVVFFLAAPPFLFGQKRQLLNTPSWPSIHTRDVTVGEKLEYIRGHFSPQNTAVLGTGVDFRLPDYYLRDYRFPSLSHQETGDWNEVTLGDDVWTLVLFNEGIDVIDNDHEALHEELLACGESLRWLERSEGQELTISTTGVGLRDRGDK